MLPTLSTIVSDRASIAGAGAGSGTGIGDASTAAEVAMISVRSCIFGACVETL